MSIFRSIIIGVVASMLFACASSHSIEAKSKEPRRYYQTIQTKKYTIVPGDRYAIQINHKVAYFLVDKEYEVYVLSYFYGGIDKKRDYSVSPVYGLAGRTKDKDGLSTLDRDKRITSRVYSSNGKRLELIVQPEPGWMFVPENGVLEVEGYNPIVTNHVLQNAKVDEINLVYRCETQTSHIGGGGQSLPADFYTLKIVKASTDDFCKVAANMIKRDYLVNVRINPEDAISRVQIPYPDIRLNPVTAPGIENVVRNLVPEEKVITVMGMIRTGRSSDYSVCDFTLFKNTKYKIEIRHPNYQFTEATFTVPDHESTISFLIGDKGSKVRVVFE